MSQRGGFWPPPNSNGGIGRSQGAFGRGRGRGRGGNGGAYHGGHGNFQNAGRGGAYRGGHGNFQGAERGAGSFSGGVVTSQGIVMGRGGMPSTGPRHGGSNAQPAMSKVQQFGPAFYKPPEGEYQDQIDATANNMGMNEHDVNCLRCGLSKADAHLDRNICHRPCVRCPDTPHIETDCPRLYCTRSWHKAHGFGLRCPNDAISSGRMRVRPTPNDIPELLRLGCTWVHDIKPIENLPTGSKRSAGNAFGEEANAAAANKREENIAKNALERIHAEIKLRVETERKMKVLTEYMHTLQRLVQTQGAEIARLHAQAGTTPAANDAWPALDATDVKPAAVQKPFFKMEDAADADEKFAVGDTARAAVSRVEDAEDNFAAMMAAEAARDQPAESQVAPMEDADVPDDEAWEGW